MGSRRNLGTSTAVVLVAAAVSFGVQLAGLFTSPVPSLLHTVAVRSALLSLGAAAAALSGTAALLHALVGVAAPERLRRWVVGLVPSLLITQVAWTNLPALQRFIWPLGLGALALAAMVGPLLHRARLPLRVSVAALAVLATVGAIAIAMPGRRLPRRTPHIVFIGLDGVDASHLSLYGYQRKTSPFLETLRPHAFVMENAYSNACCTLGATTALLTGRLPTRTHVIYPPQRLIGQDEFLHLPALLRSVGYQTYQYSTVVYGDATDAGFRDAFSEDNGRRASVSTRWLPGRFVLPYLILRRFWWEEILDRDEPAPAPAHEYLDQEKLEQTLEVLEQAKRPAFVHVHLMDTHGPRFPDVPQLFSHGPQSEWWMNDFYDDAIAATDVRLRWFFERLQKSPAGARTLVVIYSDHGMQHNTLERIPLIFYSPAYPWLTGSRDENTQIVDVAPTILGIVGMERPAWMSDGRSLLAPIDPARVILAAGAVLSGWQADGFWRLTTPNPPFFGMTSFTAIVCQRWFRFDLKSRHTSTAVLAGHARQCERPLRDVFRFVASHLQETGHPPLGADLTNTDLQLDL